MGKTIKKEEYLGRGIHNQKFLDALISGKLKPMIEAVNEDSELDIQIRNNYLNVYYNGGNVAKVTGENSVSFDKNYFYTDMKTIPTKKMNGQWKEDLARKRDALVRKFKDGDFDGYFSEAKEVMKTWFGENSKPERKTQHLLTIENHDNESDYTIIDLEYQVSTESKFACIPLSTTDKLKRPRFDIIAVNKVGTLCVIELKEGPGALRGGSGLKAHYECFTRSIDRMHGPFKQEMENLLKQKQVLELIKNKGVQIISPEPKFMFAYAYQSMDKEKKAKEDEKFERQFKEIGVPIHVIKLDKGSWRLLDI